jgi:hypothetical protein
MTWLEMETSLKQTLSDYKLSKISTDEAIVRILEISQKYHLPRSSERLADLASLVFYFSRLKWSVDL